MTREYAVIDAAGCVIATDLTTPQAVADAVQAAARDPFTPSPLTICEVHP